MPTKNYHLPENQLILGKLVEREVVQNASVMVYEVALQYERFPDYQDELLGAFQGGPNYEKAANENGFKNLGDYESWQVLCEANEIDTSAFEPDILEHWIVTDWFAQKLEAHGQKCIELFHFPIWCRCTSGQAIILDHVIGEIAQEMQILDGQRNAWNK